MPGPVALAELAARREKLLARRGASTELLATSPSMGHDRRNLFAVLAKRGAGGAPPGKVHIHRVAKANVAHGEPDATEVPATARFIAQ